jgi:DNA-binding MarR family transcriptional regulator
VAPVNDPASARGGTKERRVASRRTKALDASEVGRELLTPPVMNAWYAFLAGHRALETILSRELEAACEMSLTWFDVLGQLGRAPGRRLTMTQLAGAILFSKSGLTRLVDRMEEAGLVERLAFPGDRRSLHIALTDAGEKKFRQALPIHMETVKRHFAAYIEDGEAAALESSLTRIAAAAREEADQ